MIKRIVKVIGGLLAVVVVALGILAWTTFGNLKPLEDGATIGTGGGAVIKDGIVGVVMIYAGQQQVILIDAGNDADAKAIKAELVKRNLPIGAVKAIFLTHGHPDHIRGVGQFPNVPVYAAYPEIDLIEGRAQARSPMAKLHGKGGPTAKVTHPLKDGEVVKVGELEVRGHLVPGHTDGSMVYLIKNVLYFGDSAGSTRGGELVGAPWIFSNDTDQNRRSLAALVGKLGDAEVKTLAFAHSGPLDGLGPLEAFSKKKD